MRTSTSAVAVARFVKSIAKPNRTGRFGRFAQRYFGFHSVIPDSPTSIIRTASGLTALTRTAFEIRQDSISGSSVVCGRHVTNRGMPRSTLRARVGRGLLASCAAIVLAVAGSSAAFAADDSAKHFEIKAKPLADALMEFGVQSGLTVAAPTALTAGKRGASVRGDLLASDALGRLLKGSGLTFARADDGTIAIQAISGNSSVQTSVGESDLEKDLTESTQLEEVVVTAQKKKQALMDVPAPVTALSADALVDKGQYRLQDYYTKVPGLNLVVDGSGSAWPSIRGVTTGIGGGNPTVSVTVDDVPYGSSSTYGGATAPVPDLDPSELSRIEVLRGPQGTLYGASSIGGLIKYVTAEPSVDAFAGRAQADVSHISGGDTAYGFRAAVNLPINDQFAVRISGFKRRDGGYVDNARTGEDDVNSVDVHGGHIAALWKLSDSWSANLSALFQDRQVDGLGTVDGTLAGFQNQSLPGTGDARIKNQSFGATVTGKLGIAELTSVTGYGKYTLRGTADAPFLSFFSTFWFGVDGAATFTDASTDKFTQEFRASIPFAGRHEWRIGAFYGHEKSTAIQNWYAAVPATGAIVGNTLLAEWPTSFKEAAIFSDVTLRITDALELQIGGRSSKNKQVYDEVDGGNYSAILNSLLGTNFPTPLIVPQVRTDDNSFTYLAALKYRFSPDAMTYARVSSGYRPGGPNQSCTVYLYPCAFGPDKTQNYELGFKGEFFSRALRVDTSVYYIDWKAIQLNFIDIGGAFYANGGGAKSQGIELAVQTRRWHGLSASLTTTWNEAVLTEPLPPQSSVVAPAGARLPGSAKWSGNLALDQEFPMWNGVTGYLGASLSYVGDRVGNVGTPDSVAQMPAYAQTDLRIGARQNDWMLTAYLNNLTNRRGLLYYAAGSNDFSVIQPRTFGLSVSKEFDSH